MGRALLHAQPPTHLRQLRKDKSSSPPTSDERDWHRSGFRCSTAIPHMWRCPNVTESVGQWCAREEGGACARVARRRTCGRGCVECIEVRARPRGDSRRGFSEDGRAWLPHECDHGYRVATSYRLPYTHVLYHFMSSTQFWSIDHRLHRLLHTLHTQNRRDMSQSRPISITRIAASADSDGHHLLRTTRGSSFLGQRPAPRVDRQTSTAECGHHSCAVGTLPGASDGP